MEKLLINVVFVGGCFLSLPSFAETEETTTYGTPYSNNYDPLSFGDWNYMVHGVLPGGAASQVAGSEYSNYRASLAKKKARAECNAKADSAGKTCENAYGELEGICASFNGLLGGASAAGAKLFFNRIGVTVTNELASTISTGAALAGVSIEDSLVPCTTLTAQAMNYCAAGVAKMKSQCNF